MKDKTGGPAFPRPLSLNVNGEAAWEQDGMTLRDWFAGQALPWILRAHLGSPEWVAAEAYKLADAMLKERERNGEQ
jgi:hypothetical protein